MILTFVGWSMILALLAGWSMILATITFTGRSMILALLAGWSMILAKKYLRGPVDDPCIAGGLVNDLCKHILATIPPVSPQDNPSSLKKLIVVLFDSLSLKSFWCGIG
jgi:hypothetical protein